MSQHIAEDHILPVAAIRDQAKVGQGSLGGAHLLLPPREQVAEVYHEVTVTLSHVLREDHYTGEVVVLGRLLLLQVKS